MKIRPAILVQRTRELALGKGITIREAYKELGRRAGEASIAKRKQKQLSIQPLLPVAAYYLPSVKHGCKCYKIN